MTVDAIRGEAMMVDQVGSWHDTTRCAAIKACLKTMVPASYTKSQADDCITASAFCPHSDTTPLDCDPWRVCIKSQSKIRSAVMVFGSIANQAPLSQSLLQMQKSGRREANDSGIPDVEGCVSNAFDSLVLDNNTLDILCDCFHDMEMVCTSDGTVPLGAQPLFRCMKRLLCENPGVCCSWKRLQCTDTLTDAEIDVSCSPSFLGLHDTGAANVESIGDAMHGRRQPSGNSSSAEPVALLEDSVGAKACTKNSR